MPSDSRQFLCAIDQGTSGTSASLYDLEGRYVANSDIPIASIIPAAGWVEQDPAEVLESVRLSVRSLLKSQGVRGGQIAGVGLANQGESLLLWDRRTGKPVYNLIGWQCTRSAGLCRELIDAGLEPDFKQRTGLHLHPEWPATKIPWVLEKVPGARELRDQGRLAFSAGDSWLLYHLTRGDTCISDASTAARTGLYNLQTRSWDEALLRLFQAEGIILPQVVDSAGDFGMLDLGDGSRLPLHALILDQASALLGHTPATPVAGVFAPEQHIDFARTGVLKITYGTCIGLWCSVGAEPVDANALDCSIAWQVAGAPVFACAGEADSGASLLAWLRRNFAMTWADEELAAVAQSAAGGDEVLFVPGLKGLDAPHSVPEARGVIFGLDTASGLPHLLRATLQAMAFTARDLVESLPQVQELDPGAAIRVDGGMAANEYLMQFQADILGRPLFRADELEATSRGVTQLLRQRLNLPPEPATEESGRVFTPSLPPGERDRRYTRWKDAVARVRSYYGTNSETAQMQISPR